MGKQLVVGVMQPYLFPYIGYFQLINICDAFVIYDDVKYTKQTWINRNRILMNGQPHTFSVPLAKDSDYLSIIDRRISNTYSARSLHAMFQSNYAKAPFWSEIEPTIVKSLFFPSTSLFDFVENSIRAICEKLEIQTQIYVSSEIDDHGEKSGTDRLLNLCRKLGATKYVNPIGGIDLYSPKEFAERSIELSFLKSRLTPYAQAKATFVPGLSIIDEMAWQSPTELQSRINHDYVLVQGKDSAWLQ